MYGPQRTFVRKSFLRAPEVIRECSGISILGKRIKSLVFSTDLAIIRNVNDDTDIQARIDAGATIFNVYASVANCLRM